MNIGHRDRLAALRILPLAALLVAAAPSGSPLPAKAPHPGNELAYTAGFAKRQGVGPWWHAPLAYVGGGGLIVTLGLVAFGLRRRREPEIIDESPTQRQVDIYVIPQDPGETAKRVRSRREEASPPRWPAPPAEPVVEILPPEPEPAVATIPVKYKFFRLNAAGVIEAARDASHPDIDAALAFARSYGAGQTVEIWIGHDQIAVVD